MPWTVGDVNRFKKGLSDRQKRQWVRIANSALRRCQAAGRSNCEASAIRQANGAVSSNTEKTETMTLTMQSYVQANDGYTIRREEYQGKPHIIVPVVMMVEGVHSGSHGPILHLAEELGAFPGAWNGIPVTIQHPEDGDGNYISANSPEVIRRYAVGIVFNTRLEGDKLKADVWIDEQRITAVSPMALEHIIAGEPLEVSVGVFSDDEETSGEYNGETYNAISRNPRPDHLALLPGGVGACSWEDGCGVRANKEGGKNEVMKNENENENATVLSKEQHLADLISNAESGFREIMQTVQSKLDNMDSDVRVHYLEDVYDDYFVYTVRSRENGTPSKLFKRGYSMNDSGEITFDEEPVEVRKQVTYVTFAARGLTRTNINSKKKEVTSMAEKQKSCDGCEALVNTLIANERTKWTEEDREWLMTLEENQLTKFIPNAEEQKKTEEEEVPQLNAEKAFELVKDSIKTNEDFMKLVPDELRESIGSGLRLQKEHRARMVQSILDNTEENVWNEDDLKAMKIETLEKIFKSVVRETAVADYSLSGPVPTVKTNEHGEEPLRIVGYGKVKKEA